MKHKSGLHKKVSSIFDGAILPDELSGKAPFENDDSSGTIKYPIKTDKLTMSDFNSFNNKSQYEYKPASQLANKHFQVPVTEDQQYAALQKKKMFAVIGLFVFLMIVLFFNFYKSAKKTTANLEKAPALAVSAKVSQINWTKPEIWSDDVRDPMVFNSYAKKSKQNDDSFVIRGIVRPPDGRSSVLIGTEILYEGDKIQGWTVKEILQDVVCLEKSDGQKKELRWN